MSPAVAPLPGDATENLRAVTDPAALGRIAVVKLSSLGDIVHALPLADALRAALPGVFLGWAVKRRFVELLEGNPNLDRLYVLEGSGMRSVFSLGSRLRAERFDAALDAQGLFVSGLLTKLSGASLRVGFDWNREGNALWMTHPIVPAKARSHMVDKILGFCDALGLPRLPPRPQAYLAEREAARAEELLAAHRAAGPPACGPFVGFIVGASTPSKTWPPARWAELARRLAPQGVHPVLLGGPGEEEVAAVIVREARGAVTHDLVGKISLRVLSSILARCAVVAGGDTGPSHLAVAVGTPVLGLYGTSDPVHSGPRWGPAAATVLDYNAEAPPETRRFRHPAPGALARIPVDAVVDAVLTLLREPMRERGAAGE